MKTQITNIQELRAETARLKALTIVQEKAITADVVDIADALTPANLIINHLKESYSGANAGIVSTGINMGIELLKNHALPKKTPGFLKNILSFTAKNIAARFIKKKE